MRRSSSAPRRFVPRARALILAAAGLAAVTPTSSACVEQVYSRHIYRQLQRVLTPLSNRIELPCFDLLVVALAAGLTGWWIVRVGQARTGCRMRAMLEMAVNTAVATGVIYLVFLALWGLNYRREPLKEKLDFTAGRVTEAALVDLARESVERLNRLHAPAHAADWPELSQIASVLARPFTQAQRRLPAAPAAVPALPKTSLLGLYFRQAAVDGMTDPFFLETLINGDVLPFERPFVVAHEWAHLAGYADEAEANFVGWLTCQAGAAPVRYSGWLFLFSQLLRQVPESDRTALTAPLTAGPRGDLHAIARRLRQSVPVVRRAADRVYDRFLKANRVRAGIASYGGVVELILGARLGP